jgi:flagellar biogenesis protein FliO
MLISAVAVIGVFLYLVKRFTQKMNNGDKDTNVKIVSKVPLVAKSYLFIVRVNEQDIMLGVSDKSVTNLGIVNKNKLNTISIINDTPQDFEFSKESLQPVEDISFKSFLKSAFKQ